MIQYCSLKNKEKEALSILILERKVLCLFYRLNFKEKCFRQMAIKLFVLMLPMALMLTDFF